MLTPFEDLKVQSTFPWQNKTEKSFSAIIAQKVLQNGSYDSYEGYDSMAAMTRYVNIIDIEKTLVSSVKL